LKSSSLFYDYHNFNKWEEARLFLLELVDNNKDIIFRGQKDPKWKLSSSFERKIKPQELSHHIEDFLVGKFEKGIKAYLPSKNILSSKFELLTLMQHYGAPTRLVDFTDSPYVAAYFAFESSSESDYVTIWAVEAGWILAQNMTVYDSEVDLLKITKERLSDFRSSIDVDNLMKSNIPGIVPITPPNMDTRMLAQQTLFLMPTTLFQPFESLFEKYFKDLKSQSRQFKSPVTRIDISVKDRLNILNDLELMNINSRTLFPGLEGFAKSLNWEIELYEKNGCFADRLLK